MRLLGFFAVVGALSTVAVTALANPPTSPYSPPRILNKTAEPATAPVASPPPTAPTSAPSPTPGASVAVPEPAGAAAVDSTVSPPVPAGTVAAEKPAARPPAPPKPPSLVAKIDLTRQTMTVSAHGKPLHTWAISSGAAGYETPTGSFRPTRTEEIWYSTQYDDAPMPHSVFFNGGIATHATNATRRLGSPASHGCVRLAPRNAERFYDLVHEHGMRRTRIVVVGKTPESAMAVSRRPSRTREARRYEDDEDDRPRAVRRAPRRLYYGDRYGYAPPQPYYAPPRLVYPGDQPRYIQRW